MSEIYPVTTPVTDSLTRVPCGFLSYLSWYAIDTIVIYELYHTRRVLLTTSVTQQLQIELTLGL